METQKIWIKMRKTDPRIQKQRCASGKKTKTAVARRRSHHPSFPRRTSGPLRRPLGRRRFPRPFEALEPPKRQLVEVLGLEMEATDLIAHAIRPHVPARAGVARSGRGHEQGDEHEHEHEHEREHEHEQQMDEQDKPADLSAAGCVRT